MENQSAIVDELKAENRLLLDELATAYQNMEAILLQSSREKEIAIRSALGARRAPGRAGGVAGA